MLLFVLQFKDYVLLRITFSFKISTHVNGATKLVLGCHNGQNLIMQSFPWNQCFLWLTGCGRLDLESLRPIFFQSYLLEAVWVRRWPSSITISGNPLENIKQRRTIQCLSGGIMKCFHRWGPHLSKVLWSSINRVIRISSRLVHKERCCSLGMFNSLNVAAVTPSWGCVPYMIGNIAMRCHQGLHDCKPSPVHSGCLLLMKSSSRLLCFQHHLGLKITKWFSFPI